jgi:hypothetical protein
MAVNGFHHYGLARETTYGKMLAMAGNAAQSAWAMGPYAKALAQDFASLDAVRMGG